MHESPQFAENVRDDRVDNPADLMPARSYVKAILTGVILLVGSGLLIWKNLHSLPRLESLTVFEATVSEVHEVRDTSYRLTDLLRESQPVVRCDVRFIGRSARYRFSPDFPRIEALTHLHAGEHVKVWSDVGKTYTIFQVEQDGRILIPFDEVAAHLRENRRMDLYVYVPTLLVVAGVNFWLIGRLHHRFGTRQRKSGSPTKV